MSSGVITIFGGAVLALLLAGYLAQHYLPPPKPKIVGIDLGTTYSCIGMYHAVTGEVDIVKDSEGHKCIPSIVAFNGDDIVVGYKAEAQAEKNPQNTVYDAKRFIGKHFQKEELEHEAARYPFKMQADEFGMIRYVLDAKKNDKKITPEYIGSRILDTLRQTAERNLSAPVVRAVLSVPAEFNEEQRNYTKMAAKLAGIEVWRIINEPTAAALAYGLHKKDKVQNVLVVDLGGGTLDVSLLNIQGGMFHTQGMAGNNHLGGQDFNQRLMKHLQHKIEEKFNRPLTDGEDLQSLRLAVETTKLKLTSQESVDVKMHIRSFVIKGVKSVPFECKVTREEFEGINMDLFKKVLEPVDRVLAATEMVPEDVDEVVLVGGSTRIPKVRQLIKEYFNKEPNVAIDPELAVVMGVSIQAGIMGGMWPLTVSAIELPTRVQKIHVK